MMNNDLMSLEEIDSVLDLWTEGHWIASSDKDRFAEAARAGHKLTERVKRLKRENEVLRNGGVQLDVQVGQMRAVLKTVQLVLRVAACDPLDDLHVMKQIDDVLSKTHGREEAEIDV